MSTTTKLEPSPAPDLFAIGTRWLVNFGYETYSVVIISRHGNRIAWRRERGVMRHIDTEDEFQSPVHRKAMPLPPLPKPWWKRIFGVANAGALAVANPAPTKHDQ